MLTAFLLCSFLKLDAQTGYASEYQVKAVFLYNFTQFVDWPPRAFEGSYDPIVIGIVGKNPFGPYIEAAVSGERIGSRILRVEYFASARDITNCHILFVGTEDPDEIRRILRVAEQKNILTVGDNPNFVRWGGIIRFYTEENKIRLHINNTAAKAAGLRISSKLLRVAQVS